ncbi:MAG TPA: hypothetical protein VFJ14_02545 [Nocardioidaceae bacterium]|nr:hypothetical protein [Nocardioidaceae bacterium]
MTRRRDDAGTAIVEVTWLTLLLLVPLIYLLLSVFQMQRAAFGVDAATRAAGRAYVLAPDVATAEQRAARAAAVAMADQGIALGADALSISCAPTPDACLQPGSVVTVTLDAQVRLPLVPDLFGDFEPTARVSGEHQVPYGTFREAR